MVHVKRVIKETESKEKIERINLKQKLMSKEIETHRIRGCRNEETKIMYTDIDGLMSRKLELKDNLREKKPDVVCLTETKLSDDIQVKIEDDTYNVWRKDRKARKGGGVMILIRSNIKVTKVEYGKGKAEVLSVQIKEMNGETHKIVVAYVPPKTRCWTTEDHEELLKNTLESLEQITKNSRRVLIAGDFNCSEVNWELFEAEDENTWGNRLLTLALNNMMIQWVKENTRYRDDKPSRLDLIFTKGIELAKDIMYMCPFGKSDHIVLELELKETTEEERNESHRKERRNYAKANFPELRNFFGQVNWKEMERLKDVQQKYDFFLDKYEQGIMYHVPEYKVKDKGRKDWFNLKCISAKKKRYEAFKRMRRKPTQENKAKYKSERNEYVRIRREEEIKFERDIVEKCKEEPKLFYRYVNGKMKNRDSITKLRENDIIYEDPKEMSEILNRNFQMVFTRESEFQQLQEERRGTEMMEIEVNQEEIMKLMNDLEERKANGPDKVSGHILKECRHQLIKPVHDIIKCSLETGKVPKEWKRADIVPIYKNGNREHPLNYRPVSLTSVICKLCEKVIKKRWTKYLEGEGILTDRQFGFRKKKFMCY